MTATLRSGLTAVVRKVKKVDRSFLLIVLGVIVACLFPLYHTGWPVNHEFLAFVYRTNIYLAHMLHGDVFPIWSSSDAFGLGTPEAFFYHKSFYYVASIFFGVFSSMQVALVITIGAFLLVGAYGFRRLLKSAGITQSAILIVFPLLFISSNYVFTNWLIRGAMAEFAAMMILPWLVVWCVDVIIKKRLSFTIVPIFVLLYFSHNIIALFSLPLMTVAFVIFVITSARALSPNKLVLFAKSQAIRGCVIVASLIGLMLPYIYIYMKYSPDYSPSGITSQGYLATQNFLPKSAYLFSSPFRWLQDGVTMNLNVGYIINLVVIGSILLYLFLLITKKAIQQRAVVLFFVISLSIYWVIILPKSSWLYTKISILQFIQFPWRNLTFITTLSLCLGAMALSELVRINKQLGLIVLVTMAIGSIGLSPVTYYRSIDVTYLPKDLVEEKYVGTQKKEVPPSIIGIGQYLPLLVKNGKDVPVREVLNGYVTDAAAEENHIIVANGCQAHEMTTDFESNTKAFRVSCSQPTEVILPVNYTGMTKARWTSNNGKQKLDTFRTPNDGRIHVRVPANGDGVITIRLPRLL